jgi:hypothetical protein
VLVCPLKEGRTALRSRTGGQATLNGGMRKMSSAAGQANVTFGGNARVDLPAESDDMTENKMGLAFMIWK